MRTSDCTPPTCGSAKCAAAKAGASGCRRPSASTIATIVPARSAWFAQGAIGVVQRRRLALLGVRLLAAQHEQVRVVDRGEDVRGAVLGAVVDDDDPPAPHRHLEQALDAVGDRHLLVQRRHQEDPGEALGSLGRHLWGVADRGVGTDEEQERPKEHRDDDHQADREEDLPRQGQALEGPGRRLHRSVLD